MLPWKKKGQQGDPLETQTLATLSQTSSKMNNKFLTISTKSPEKLSIKSERSPILPAKKYPNFHYRLKWKTPIPLSGLPETQPNAKKNLSRGNTLNESYKCPKSNNSSQAEPKGV